ncbi:MAG: two pore domain potassium channel family protein [Saprospiraceae bacterium]|nr:two pore domain potassium channel family protein [Saprospiraceae bacterium]
MVGSTIGFGDYYPVTLPGKVLSSFQAILFFLYVVLFMSYFNNKNGTHQAF